MRRSIKSNRLLLTIMEPKPVPAKRYPWERRPVIASFGQNRQVLFPLLSMAASGGLLEVLPEGPVPLTAVFVNGKTKTLWIGHLTLDRRVELAREFGISAGKATLDRW